MTTTPPTLEQIADAAVYLHARFSVLRTLRMIAMKQEREAVKLRAKNPGFWVEPLSLWPTENLLKQLFDQTFEAPCWRAPGNHHLVNTYYWLHHRFVEAPQEMTKTQFFAWATYSIADVFQLHPPKKTVLLRLAIAKKIEERAEGHEWDGEGDDPVFTQMKSWERMANRWKADREQWEPVDTPRLWFSRKRPKVRRLDYKMLEALTQQAEGTTEGPYSRDANSSAPAPPPGTAPPFLAFPTNTDDPTEESAPGPETASAADTKDTP